MEETLTPLRSESGHSTRSSVQRQDAETPPLRAFPFLLIRPRSASCRSRRRREGRTPRTLSSSRRAPGLLAEGGKMRVAFAPDLELGDLSPTRRGSGGPKLPFAPSVIPCGPRSVSGADPGSSGLAVASTAPTDVRPIAQGRSYPNPHRTPHRGRSAVQALVPAEPSPAPLALPRAPRLPSVSRPWACGEGRAGCSPAASVRTAARSPYFCSGLIASTFPQPPWGHWRSHSSIVPQWRLSMSKRIDVAQRSVHRLEKQLPGPFSQGQSAELDRASLRPGACAICSRRSFLSPRRRRPGLRAPAPAVLGTRVPR